MPTSSQALILFKETVQGRPGATSGAEQDAASASTTKGVTQKCVFKRRASYCMTGINEAKEGERLSQHTMYDQKFLKSHFEQKDRAERRQSMGSTANLPRIKSKECKTEEKSDRASPVVEMTKLRASHSIASVREIDLDLLKALLIPPRPSTAPRYHSVSNLKTNYVNPMVREKLLQMGFFKKTLGVKPDCVYDDPTNERTAARTAALKSAEKTKPKSAVKIPAPKIVRLDSDDKASPVNSDTEQACGSKLSPSTIRQWVEELENKTDQNSEAPDPEEGDDTVQDQIEKVKPATHMRKDEEESRPLAAIFSFRDNEYSSHGEVKYLIETQIKVKVKTIQFDPLDIRTTERYVHSRWLVEFFTVKDLETAIEKGIILGRQQLLFYKYDDIIKRELSSFKFYKSIQESIGGMSAAKAKPQRRHSLAVGQRPVARRSSTTNKAVKLKSVTQGQSSDEN